MIRHFRKTWLLVFIAGAALLTVNVGWAASDSGSVLKVGLASDMLTFDPANYKAGQDATMQNFVYETLVAYDKDMKIVPKLAVSWSQLGPTQWEFKLRKGVKFTDGTPFDGNAVKVSLERCSAAPRGSGFVGFIKSVTVKDPQTVVVNLKYPFGPILNNLANPVASIPSPKAIEEYGDKISKNPVGTGPYKLLEWIPNTKLTFEQNPGYWGKLPAIKRLEFTPIPEESTRLMALKSGQVDLIENPPPSDVASLKKDPSFHVIQDPRARNVWLGMNVNKGALKNLKVREAIQCAVDKNIIVKAVLEGMGRVADKGFIPPEICPTDPPINVPFDQTKAKKLLAEAGFKDGLKLNLWSPDNRYLADKQVAQVIQQQLKEVGIDIEITVMEWGSYLAALGRHEGELFIIGWGFMTGEPSQALRQTMSSGNAFNYSDYNDPQFDALLAKAEQEPDFNKRISIYHQMSDMIIIKNRVVVPLYYMYNSYASSSKVSGVIITPIELIDVSKATIKQ